MTKEKEANERPSVVKLDGLHEEALEEGLLENHTNGEAAKQVHKVRSETDDTAETTALAPELVDPPTKHPEV